MTQEEITQNNRLIAEFMGMQETKLGWYDAEKAVPLPTMEVIFEFLDFHVDWNWLMSVVDKIEDFFLIKGALIEFQVVSFEDEVKVVAKHLQKPWETIVEISADGSGKKENTYNAVVAFVKWHNENK